MNSKVKVLIVDDSALVRKIFTDIINNDPSLEVVGIAQNGIIANRKIEELKPDIITLDLEMPELDGFGVLEEMIKKNLQSKVLMVSGLTRQGAQTTIKALEMGAVDFIEKPSGRTVDLKEISDSLLNKLHEIAKIDSRKITKRLLKKIPTEPIIKTNRTKDIPKVFIAIGISTGGPQALKEIFQDPAIPDDCAYLVVQHMPPEFTGPFSERLNQISKIHIKEAENNEPILIGSGYIAPGHSHLEIEFRQSKPYIKLSQTGKVSGHMPSADVLFNSIARSCAKDTIALIMTGMGRDGAEGINKINNLGGQTIAQDKESSVVFGMNKEAIELGAIKKVVSLKDIPVTLNSLLTKIR